MTDTENISPNTQSAQHTKTHYNTSKIQYYTPNELKQHNTQHNLYVSLFNNILNLTSLITKEIQQNPVYTHYTYTLIKYAGTDISHWFQQDPLTHHITPKSYIDSILNCRVPYLPLGPVCHISPAAPITNFDMTYGNNGVEWYNDPQYIVGRLTAQLRTIHITNTLTSVTDTIEVCCENTIYDIMERYKSYNNICDQYTWKYQTQVLDYNKTLHDNGIPDETSLMSELNMNHALYIPELHIYYNDNIDVL